MRICCSELREVMAAKLISIFVALLFISLSVTATVAENVKVTPQDFDLSCASRSKIEADASKGGTTNRSVAIAAWSFYLGRLSARDEKTNWDMAVKNIVAATTPEQKKDAALYTSCTNFYAAKFESTNAPDSNAGIKADCSAFIKLLGNQRVSDFQKAALLEAMRNKGCLGTPQR